MFCIFQQPLAFLHVTGADSSLYAIMKVHPRESTPATSAVIYPVDQSGMSRHCYLPVRVERGRDGEVSPGGKFLKQAVAGIKHTRLVSSSVELLEQGMQLRSERRTKRIFDQRIFV